MSLSVDSACSYWPGMHTSLIFPVVNSIIQFQFIGVRFGIKASIILERDGQRTGPCVYRTPVRHTFLCGNFGLDVFEMTLPERLDRLTLQAVSRQ